MFNRIVHSLTKIGFLFVTILSIFSCEEEIKIVIEEQNLELSDNAEIAVNYPKLSSSDSSTNIINDTLESYIASQLNLDEEPKEKQTLIQAASAFDQEFKSFKEEFPDSAQQWEAFIDAEVTYQSPMIICIAINTYLDTGGAHGNSHIEFLNFDSKTGKFLKFNELISNTNELKLVIKDYLEKEIKSKTDEAPQDLFFGEGFQLPETLGFNEDGLIVLYHPYELATYTQTIIEFTIPFGEISDLLLRN